MKSPAVGASLVAIAVLTGVTLVDFVLFAHNRSLAESEQAGARGRLLCGSSRRRAGDTPERALGNPPARRVLNGTLAGVVDVVLNAGFQFVARAEDRFMYFVTLVFRRISRRIDGRRYWIRYCSSLPSGIVSVLKCSDLTLNFTSK